MKMLARGRVSTVRDSPILVFSKFFLVSRLTFRKKISVIFINLKQQLFFLSFQKTKQNKNEKQTSHNIKKQTNKQTKKKTEEDNKQWTTRKKFFVMFNSPSDSSHDISLINIDTLISLKIFIFYSVVIMFDM